MREKKKPAGKFSLKKTHPMTPCEVKAAAFKEKKSSFGRMKGTGKVIGALIEPIDEKWNTCS